MKTYYVYAICSGRGPNPFLQVEFSGSRWQCQMFIRDKVRNRRPTHFNVISCCGMSAAERRYLP